MKPLDTLKQLSQKFENEDNVKELIESFRAMFTPEQFEAIKYMHECCDIDLINEILEDK